MSLSNIVYDDPPPAFGDVVDSRITKSPPLTQGSTAVLTMGVQAPGNIRSRKISLPNNGLNSSSTGSTTSSHRPLGLGMKIPPTTSLSAAIKEAAAKAKREDASENVIKASLLAPRVAVILNVPKKFHFPLFFGRLISIFPAIFWGWRPALMLLDQMLPGAESEAFPKTEIALASMWCFAAGYLAFFFEDCLMSRWLINYTPQATIVRLLSINAVNIYGTNITLKLSGAFYDIRLFLPAWIALSAFLTGAYHVTHQKINIRKETVTSINVFSIASSISMVSLLLVLYSSSVDLPDIPIVIYLRVLFSYILKGLVKIRASLRSYQSFKA